MTSLLPVALSNEDDTSHYLPIVDRLLYRDGCIDLRIAVTHRKQQAEVSYSFLLSHNSSVLSSCSLTVQAINTIKFHKVKITDAPTFTESRSLMHSLLLVGMLPESAFHSTA